MEISHTANPSVLGGHHSNQREQILERESDTVEREGRGNRGSEETSRSREEVSHSARNSRSEPRGFSDVDSDGDGSISRDEFAAFGSSNTEESGRGHRRGHGHGHGHGHHHGAATIHGEGFHITLSANALEALLNLQETGELSGSDEAGESEPFAVGETDGEETLSAVPADETGDVTAAAEVEAQPVIGETEPVESVETVASVDPADALAGLQAGLLESFTTALQEIVTSFLADLQSVLASAFTAPTEGPSDLAGVLAESQQKFDAALEEARAEFAEALAESQSALEEAQANSGSEPEEAVAELEDETDAVAVGDGESDVEAEAGSDEEPELA